MMVVRSWVKLQLSKSLLGSRPSYLRPPPRTTQHRCAHRSSPFDPCGFRSLSDSRPCRERVLGSAIPPLETLMASCERKWPHPQEAGGRAHPSQCLGLCLVSTGARPPRLSLEHHHPLPSSRSCGVVFSSRTRTGGEYSPSIWNPSFVKTCLGWTLHSLLEKSLSRFFAPLACPWLGQQPSQTFLPLEDQTVARCWPEHGRLCRSFSS
mmetsp:Transcript_34500/g.53865  ORF Transcript_34500/g.53865 Transcript_34500/m.53865 type:complete len:208 (-) Transcript_34500:14-637(-)